MRYIVNCKLYNILQWFILQTFKFSCTNYLHCKAFSFTFSIEALTTYMHTIQTFAYPDWLSWLPSYIYVNDGCWKILSLHRKIFHNNEIFIWTICYVGHWMCLHMKYLPGGLYICMFGLILIVCHHNYWVAKKKIFFVLSKRCLFIHMNKITKP